MVVNFTNTSFNLQRPQVERSNLPKDRCIWSLWARGIHMGTSKAPQALNRNRWHNGQISYGDFIQIYSKSNS